MIPLFKPSCSKKEIEYVTQVLRSGWWGIGPKVAELEEKFAARVGSKYAVAVHSCTMAIQMALQALEIDAGEIIMPALTFAATGLAALHNGAQPVFADINEDTLCIDWADACRKITPDTRAIIPVWYGGVVIHPTGSEALRLDYSAIPVIEDCAHAAGNPAAGKFGTGCWSFNAVKNIACGDGGMITTDDWVLAEKLRQLRRFGIDRPGWDYEIPEAGWKEDMNDISAAIALAQLERLDETNRARRNIVDRYYLELEDLEWLKLPVDDPRSSWHMFVVRTERRDEFIGHMQANGVSAGVHYKPLNQHPIFGKCELPVTDRVWKTLVTLPLYPDMTGAEIDRVIAAVRSFR